MSIRIKEAVRYLMIQILLDLLFCILAGAVSIFYGTVVLDEEFEYVILIAAPAVYMMFVFARYVTVFESIPRIILCYLICSGRRLTIGKAFLVGIVSYAWVILTLQVIYSWDQGSWFFPFDNVEGMSIYVAAMVLSTLASPSAINFLERKKANKVKNVP